MESTQNYRLPEGRALGLKVVRPGGVPESWLAPRGFRWNLTLGGWTEAPDWSADPWCGRGLHLWAWARGDLDASEIWLRPDVIWLVVEYDTSPVVDLVGMIKVPKCRTAAISTGLEGGLFRFIQEFTPEREQNPPLFDVVEAEEGGTAIAPPGCGRAAAFVLGNGRAEAGVRGYARAGHGGTAIAGHMGTAIAGDAGYARAGSGGTAKAGDGGIAEVVYGGEGSACAGIGGKLIFQREGGSKAFMVGEGGVKPGKFYRFKESKYLVEQWQ